MDLLPLPGDASLAGIGDGQAGPVAPVPRGPGPGGAPQGEEVVVARRRGLEAANRRQRGKAEEALLEALRRLQARGEVSSPPPFPGPSRGFTGGCRGLYGRGSDPGPRFGVPGYPGRIPFHPREASLPHASPCGVYAVIPGDPPQLHASRPPRQALPGPSPARRRSFAQMGDLRPLRTFPLPWERRCYRR